MKPRVFLLTTGGTIACRLVNGALVPVASGDELLATLPESVRNSVELTVESICSVSGWNMTPTLMRTVSLRANELLSRDDVDAVVVSHGTDTVEETMLAVDLLRSRSHAKPVVFVAAMKSLADASPDGPANLRDALLVAASKRTPKGTFLVVNGEIHCAWYVTKTDASNVHTFESPNFGKVGSVTWDGPRFSVSEIPRCALFGVGMETQIHLVKVYTGMQSFTLPDKSAGLVVEGTGAGNVPDEVAHQLQTLKIPIVIVSRCAKGFLSPTYGSDGGGNALKKMGCILGMGLNAQKARILLMVALGSGLQAREQLVALFEHNEMN